LFWVRLDSLGGGWLVLCVQEGQIFMQLFATSKPGRGFFAHMVLAAKYRERISRIQFQLAFYFVTFDRQLSSTLRVTEWTPVNGTKQQLTRLTLTL
jgi:hypothetical protein